MPPDLTGALQARLRYSKHEAVNHCHKVLNLLYASQLSNLIFALFDGTSIGQFDPLLVSHLV